MPSIHAAAACRRRSLHPHCRRSAAASRAIRTGVRRPARYLAVGETKFFGEPVAAIAAETREAAETAAGLIRVEHEELPAVLVDRSRARSASPRVQDTPGNQRSAAGTNISSGASAGATCGPRLTWSSRTTTRFRWSRTLRSSPTRFSPRPMRTASPCGVRCSIPTCCSAWLPPRSAGRSRKVRIIAPDPGGGFGGKGWPKFEPLLAFLALETGRPVRLVLTLEETFQAARRSSARVHIAHRLRVVGPNRVSGYRAPISCSAPMPISARAWSARPAMRLAVRIARRTPASSRARCSRTPPRARPSAASERRKPRGRSNRNWTKARERLGIDRVEIRRRNLPARGEAFIPGDTPADGDWDASASESRGRNRLGRPPSPRIAAAASRSGLKSSSTASVSFALVRLHHDGSVSVMSATSDMGQGARTVFTQIAAHELGVAAGSRHHRHGRYRGRARSIPPHPPAARPSSWATRSSRRAT